MFKAIIFIAVAAILGGSVVASSPAHAGSSRQIVLVSNRDGDADIYAADRDGNNPRRLTHTSEVEESPAVAPNRRDIIFSALTDEASWRHALKIVNTETQTTTTLLEEEGVEYNAPTWSPDGKRIAYSSVSSDSGYKSCINVLTIATLQSEEIVCQDTLVAFPDWSPNGEQLLYTEYVRATGGKLHLIDAYPGGQKKYLRDGFASFFSPSGDKIAFSAYDSNYRNQVFVANADGTSARQLTNDSNLNMVSDWADDLYITYASVDPATFQFKVKGILQDGSGQIEMPPKSDTTYDGPGQGLL